MAEYTNFQSGQKITKQVLTNQVSTGIDALDSRLIDNVSSGVLKDLLNEFVFIVGTNSTGGSPTVTVQTGIAYNSNGERIILSDDTVLFNSANPTATTPDGIGGSTLTPKSTGSKNVALTANTSNFVWLDYLETIDSTVFTLHKITGQKLFYSHQDGYKLGVNGSAVTPPGGFSASAILLGLVITNSSLTNGTASFDQSLKPNFGTQLYRVRVDTPQLDRSDATVTYTAAQTIFVDDHIKAVGSNPISGVNPHGLSAADIGITDPGGLEHQRFLHTGGIISSSIGGDASAFFMQPHTSGIASENYVEIFPLASNEVAVVDGATFDSTSNGASVQFSFVDTNGDPLPNGVHTIYLDSADRMVKRALPSAFNTSDATLQRIWDINWASPTLQASSENDYRLFGTLGPQNMRFELLGGLVSGLATGTRSMTFTYDIDDKVTQIGIGGDNGTISGSITLVTFAYNISDQVVLIGAEYGHKLLSTTITYSGDLVDTITETVV